MVASLTAMKAQLFLTLIGAAVLSLCYGDEKYLLVSPKVFRNGTISTLSATFYQLKEDITLTLTVVNGRSNKNIAASSSYRFLTSDAGKAREIDFLVPATLPSGTALLGAKAETKDGRVIFDDSRRIRIKLDATKMFIQSDKAIYKPGETVKFRVVAVRPDLKPGDGKLTEVYIKNPSGSRMIQWKQVALNTGFASFAMKISKKPLLGNWKIEAKYDGKKVSKIIKIDKYVLPKIAVEIKAPESLLYKRKNFEVSVCAKYTYGKPARGKAIATFCLKRRWAYWRRSVEFSCVQVMKKIFGCEDIPVRYSELGDLRYSYGYMVRINVSFEEDGTNLKFKADHNITKIEYRDTKLSFQGTPNNFKPGFPVKGQLKVADPSGRPIVGSRKVTITATSNNGVIFQDERIVENGLMKFSIETESKMEYISLLAEYNSKYRKNVQPYYRRSQTSHRISAWYSRSKNFLLVQDIKSPLKIGKTTIIYVKGTGDKIPENTVSYQLLCRGNTLLTGTYKVIFTRGKEFQGKISLTATPDMVPKCRLLTYYVRSDGEFISDFALVNFEESYENQVSVKFSDAQRRPGDDVTLDISAYPGSRFALSAVDKSVQLLAKNNDLKSSDIMGILEGQDVGPTGGYYGYWPGGPRKRCRGRPWHRGRRSVIYPHFGSEFVDGTASLSQSGVVYFSNLAIDVKPCPTYVFRGLEMESTRISAKARPGSDGAVPVAGVVPKRKIDSNNVLRKGKVKPKTAEAPRVRKDFPETWLWTEDVVNNKTGKKMVRATVPDTLTTWYANAFAVSPIAGIGVAKTSSLLVFQPFFVSLALPYSVIRGEKVEIPTTIFNYLDACLSIRLELHQSDKYKIEGDPVINVCACSDKSVTARFKIVATALGKIDITVQATAASSNICGSNKVAQVAAADAVSKKLLVEAEGIKKESTFNSYFCLQDDKDTHKETIPLYLSDLYVPGSVYATFSIFGDLMGPSLSNLDKLLAMPYGCGEQNMLNFAPNIYILDYLTKSGQLTPAVKSRAIEYMLAGYQRELTYRRKDGSYSAFGNRDKEGSTWLTAFVLRCFGEAQRYIDIDDEDITVSRKWLLSLQKSDGCFRDVGMVHHREMKGGVSSGVTMTAFVLVALLETGISKTDKSVQNALQCITKDLDSVDDAYTAAILAYTLSLAGSQYKSKMMDTLQKMAISGDGMTHWESKAKSESPKEPWYMYSRARSADIEITAYALMSYLQRGLGVSIPIIRWLAKQRNSLGGFSSTQDTCVALQALSKNAETTSKAQDLTILMKAPQLTHTFKVTTDNKLVLQRVELPKLPGNVTVEASGVGCALLQTNVKFNEEKEKMKPAFTIDVKVTRDGIFGCRHKLNICARYNKGTSNMAMIDVQMVSGFEPLTEDLDKILQSTENVLMKDYEFEGNMLSIYFNEIGSDKVCISFGMEEKQKVEDRKPAPIKVYDYYDTSKSATVMHSVEKCSVN